jgi:hypothetical protein
MEDGMNENDRELLEAAAMAAEIEIDTSPYSGAGGGNDGFDVMGNVVLDWHDGETWNPLTNDGDALRLAVKLGIEVKYYPKESSVEAWTSNYVFHSEDNGNDPCAATRRVIVRAAAALAQKQKP